MEQQPPSGAQQGTSQELFGGGATTVASQPLTSGGGYPVEVTFERPAHNNRFFAIPVLGITARYILLIPHLVILYALGAVAGVLNLVTWIPVISSGTYPDWGTQLIGGYVRWSARVFSYLLGLTDRYPPFSLGGNDDYAVQVNFDVPAHSSRFWAIPIVGYMVKMIILIPHLIALMVMLLVVYVLQIVLWIPVLFGGKYPAAGYSIVGGTLRWATRLSAYFYGLTDQYPPFSLS